MTKKLKFKMDDEVIFLKNAINVPEGTRARVITAYSDVPFPYRVRLESAGHTELCLEDELEFYEPEEPFIPPANNQGVWS